MIIFLHILYPLTSAFSLSACLSFTSLSWRSDLRSAWPLLCAVTWHIQWPLWAIVGHCGPLWAIVGHCGPCWLFSRDSPKNSKRVSAEETSWGLLLQDTWLQIPWFPHDFHDFLLLRVHCFEWRWMIWIFVDLISCPGSKTFVTTVRQCLGFRSFPEISWGETRIKGRTREELHVCSTIWRFLIRVTMIWTLSRCAALMCKMF